jgi:LytS/YehU family sensor histidine kinase
VFSEKRSLRKQVNEHFMINACNAVSEEKAYFGMSLVGD